MKANEQSRLNLNQNADRSNLRLKEKLNKLPGIQHSPTIYKVHNGLRNTNSEAYEPTLVAIGPYHRHKHNLQKMETQKLRYLHRLLQRHSKKIEDCVSAVEKHEREARECYADPIALNSIEFTEMLVLDGCFIIEYLYRREDGNLRDKYDLISGMNWALGNVERDLLLFENQVPFFILYELFHLMEPGETAYRRRVTTLLAIYGVNFHLKLQPEHLRSPTNIKHLLELIHESLVFPNQENFNEGDRLDFIGSATSLVESNMRFRKSNKDDVSIFQMDFQNGFIELPSLAVVDVTESYFRNLIAYEQYFLDDSKYHVSDYAKLMDCLINTPDDVKLLSDRHIIENWLGSEKEVAKMFNGLGDGVMVSSKYFAYKGEFKKVNEHCNRRWNKWIAILNHNHFNSPWGILSIVGAILLLVLTLVQTVFSIIG